MRSSTSSSELLRRLPPLEIIQAEKRRRAIERERERLARDADKIRARCSTLAGFVKEAWHVLEPETPLLWNWHLDVILAHLEAITRGTFLGMGLQNRVLFNVPPGSLKSLLISVFWQAWEWGPFGQPNTRFVSTSWSEEYVKRDTRKTRDLIASPWYQALWGDKVQLVRSGETSFENGVRGNREGRPFPSLLGVRGDRLLIDDPHSTETVESDAERARSTRIFRESVPSRINDPRRSAIVVIMQRLRTDDVSGLIEQLELPYIHVMLPMFFDPKRRFISPLGLAYSDPRTEDGEVIHPERFTPEVLKRDGDQMTAYARAAQWDQRPQPRGGLMFKRSWFGVVEAVPAGGKTVRGWDLAGTKGKPSQSLTGGPAWTVGVKITRAEGRFYVEHVVRDRVGPMDVRSMVKNTADQDGRGVEIDLPQDPGQAAKGQVADFISMLAGYKAYASIEDGAKEVRAEPLAAQAEAGNVFLLAGPWNDAYLDELETFPSGRFKDQVDASSRAFARLSYPGIVLTGPIVVSGGRRDIPGQGAGAPPPGNGNGRPIR